MRCRVVASRTAVAVASSGAALGLCALLCAPTAKASFETFDFESVAPSAPTYGAAGALTALSLTSNNITVDFTRTSGAAFDVMDLTGQVSPFLFPVTWGSNSLSPFVSSDINDKFNANFAGDAVVGATLQYGDFGADEGLAHIEVWSGADGSGALLYSAATPWSGDLNSDPPGGFAFVGAAAIGSIQFWGEGEEFSQSLYWDNLVVEVIPTPETITLLGVAAAGLSWRRRR